MENIDLKIKMHLDMLVERYPTLVSLSPQLIEAYVIFQKTYVEGKKVMIIGNGGSAADSEHIVGELMKSFKKERKLDTKMQETLVSIDEEKGKYLATKLQGALPTVSLVSQIAINTAFANDVDPRLVYAQQVFGYGQEGDTLLCISTSGNSDNIIYAAITAKAKKMKVVGLTGERNSKLSDFSDICVRVPETETFKVQELHLPIYHCWCAMLEDFFF